MAYPQYLKNFAVFADGRGYVGLATEATLPKITSKTQEYQGGGMDTPVEVVVGTEKLECSFTLAEYNPAVLSLWGITTEAETQFTLRGAAQSQGENAVAIVATIGGRVKELDSGTWKAGDQATLKVTVAVTYYRLSVNGVDVIEIDALNMKRVINGVDQLASVRTALGI